MKYDRFVFTVTTWPKITEDMVETTVIVELTTGMTHAMQMVIEDWDSKTQGEIRAIAVKGITTIDRSEEEPADA